jgi:hypothetical protein
MKPLKTALRCSKSYLLIFVSLKKNSKLLVFKSNFGLYNLSASRVFSWHVSEDVYNSYFWQLLLSKIEWKIKTIPCQKNGSIFKVELNVKNKKYIIFTNFWVFCLGNVNWFWSKPSRNGKTLSTFNEFLDF